MKTVLAPHALGKIKPDAIFTVGEKAREAKAKFGKDQVVDGSIGILLDDEGQLALLPSVEQATQQLRPADIAPYAPIAGTNEFKSDVVSYLFGENSQVLPTAAVATAGATGALRLGVWNFLELGDTLITHDYFWGPYGTMARDALRNFETFPTFTDDGGFNVKGCLELTEQTLKKQGRSLVIINSPCHNPSGMSLTLHESRALKDGFIEICKRNPDQPLTLMMDIAYWEYEDPKVNTQFLQLFNDLPENFTFCMAYSISKSLTRYGFRTGALVVRSAKKEFLDEIMGTMGMSIRAMWSNTPRIGQAVFSTIYRSEKLRRQLVEEQQFFAALSKKRGNKFMEEANACGLETTPYAGGFFVTVPCEDSKLISEKLFKKNIYLVPMKMGVRVAFCAIPTHQIPGLAQKIHGALHG